MSKKAVVLSSGGLDSSTCIAWAVHQRNCYDEVVSLSLRYGQRHDKEVHYAQKIADYYNLRHYEISLDNIYQFSDCNLLAKNEDTIPDKSYVDQIKENGEGRVSTYVPFRNGLMLSAAAAISDSLFTGEAVDIVYGAHADDAAGRAYADCSPDFVSAMSNAINIGTYGNINIVAPFVDYTKADIVKCGITLGVPFELTWSCYHGGEYPCHKCGTCIDRENAFRENGLEDPWIKKEEQLNG